MALVTCFLNEVSGPYGNGRSLRMWSYLERSWHPELPKALHKKYTFNHVGVLVVSLKYIVTFFNEWLLEALGIWYSLCLLLEMLQTRVVSVLSAC